jgi:hypothetical protein
MLFSSRYKTRRSLTSRHAAKRPSPDALLHTLESRVLMAATPLPMGHIDVLNRSKIAGWAYSPTAGPAAATIEVTINGVKTSIAAKDFRQDLVVLGSPYHAFSYTMPTLMPGLSTVIVQAVDPTTGARTTMSSTTVNNPAPVYHLDVTSSSRIAGWAYDPDTNAPIQIRIDVNGVAGTPFTTDKTREDVATVFHTGNHTSGFDVAGDFAGKVVEVYAYDSPSNNPRLIYTNNKKPKGYVDVNNGFKVSGWAFDPDDSSAHVKIRVLIDGVLLSDTDATADITRSDLTAVAGSPDHAYSIDLPGLTPGKHQIAVFAVDAQAASAPAVLLGYTYVTNAPPTGHVDLVGNTLIRGWALDQDLGANAAQVSIYVDDFLYTTVDANQSRPDLVKYFGSPNHGFTVNLTDLGLTSHSITVTVHDNRTSNQDEIVIYDDFINNRQPQGSFDAVKNGQVKGWAWDPDAPGTAVAVDVYVDGVFAKTSSANVHRDDLQNALGSADHGFAIDMPALSFGTHRIDLYAAESQGNVSTLIGSKTVTNSRPTGYVELINATTIKGWAADPDRLDIALDMKVFVNGVLVTTGTAGDERQDLVPFLGGANYGFTITLPTLVSGANQIDVYTVDRSSGLLIALGSKSIMVNAS